MWATIWHLILRIFGLIKNPVKPPELDAPALPDKDAVKHLPPKDEAEGVKEEEETDEAPDKEPPKPSKPTPQPPSKWEQRWSLFEEMINRPFDGPLHTLPARRYPKTVKLANNETKTEPGVYSVYGRAPKEKGNKKYPKAKLRVFENLPGSWNKNRPRLYMEHRVGEYFREGLSRCEELEDRVSDIMGEAYEVLSYMYSIGAYSHRHIRHNPKNQLSYHSWAIAFDQNPGWNRGVTKYRKWQRRVKKNGKTIWVDCKPHVADRGPIHKVMPFSKQYYEVFPKSMPIEVFVAFISVGFASGLTWGRMKWLEVLKLHGDRYDQDSPKVNSTKEFRDAMDEWSTMTYYDGMHFELTMRGSWAKMVWEKNQARLQEGVS